MKDLIYETGLKIRQDFISSNPLQKADDTAKAIEAILKTFAESVIEKDLRQMNNETGKQTIIRLFKLGIDKKRIEQISGCSRQYVHSTIKDQYVKMG